MAAKIYFNCIFFLAIYILISCQEKRQDNQKALIGRYLFFDTQLSINNTKSCSSCHNPKFAFTDGYRQSVTALGESTLHNSPSLINVSKLKVFDWANPTIQNLEQQMLRPLFSNKPIELGTNQKINELKQYFKNNEPYKTLITNEFGLLDTLKIENVIIKSIKAYLLTLNSNNSKFDKYLVGSAVLNPSEEKGRVLFFSERLKCSSCHALPNFTLATILADSIYKNTGLYNVNNQNYYPETDPGLSYYTNNANDNGKFKIPSLRNVAQTAPYMHDGSVASLGDVLDIYKAGGRNIAAGLNKGNGRQNKFKSELIKGFTLNNVEKRDLLLFLQTLTDSTIFQNPAFQNPFNN